MAPNEIQTAFIWHLHDMFYHYLEIAVSKSDLKLGKTIAMQFLCSMTMLVVKKFNLTCSSILSVLYKFLK